MKAHGTLWGYYTGDQWLAESTGLHRTSWDSLFSLRNGFTAYAVISPETSSWLTPSPPVQLTPSRQLDASNGRQDHTVLPYAFVALRLRDISVHRNPSNVRDDGRRPSDQDGMAKDMHLIWIEGKEDIFDFRKFRT